MDPGRVVVSVFKGERAMKKLMIAVPFVLVMAAPSLGQPLREFASPTLGLPVFDPALSGLILDTVTPVRPVSVPTLQTPVRSGPMIGSAAPSSGVGFDWPSGSSYRWSKTPGGHVRIRGLVPSAGATWTGSISAGGSTIAVFDREMNYWRYNLNTGTRVNTTTGEVCVGQGVAGCFR